MKQVNSQNLWNFKIGSQETINVPILSVIGFQQRDKRNSQNLNNDTFCRLRVASCQCTVGTEKYHDAGIILNYDDDDYSREIGQIKERFRALTENDLLKPYISDHDFRSSNTRVDEVGYSLYVFDIRYQPKITNSQSIEVEFKVDGVVPNVINGYALVLTNKMESVSSDGQRHFDLI